jgi:hypothetical protein
LSRVIAVQVFNDDTARIVRFQAAVVGSGGTSDQDIVLDGSGKHAEQGIINVFTCVKKQARISSTLMILNEYRPMRLGGEIRSDLNGQHNRHRLDSPRSSNDVIRFLPESPKELLSKVVPPDAAKAL